MVQYSFEENYIYIHLFIYFFQAEEKRKRKVVNPVEDSVETLADKLKKKRVVRRK